MNKIEFPLLKAEQIEVRVSTISEKGCSLLLYKDARCDMNILDEIVGAYNWKREHTRENANCIVSLWNENKKEWISKEDTGTESYAEKEKGLASDSFKRACFNWGIGRELYTAPFIWISADKVNLIDKGSKKSTYDTFTVSKIEYTDKSISNLEIINDNKTIVYSMKNSSKQNSDKENPPPNSQSIICVNCKKEIKGYTSKSGKEVTAESVKQYSEKNFGRCLCWDCQSKAK